jgi:uncharacterized membrane protein
MRNTDFQTGNIRAVECVKEGFERIKKDYWLLFAISLVGALIGGATMYILLGAMVCGMFYAMLKAVDGHPVVFDDLWKGMNYFGPGLLVILIVIVPTIAYYIWVYVTFFAAVFGGAQVGEAGMVGGLIVAGLIDVVLLVGLISFHTLLTFTFPLLVDRNLGAIEAMKTSAKAVWANLSGVLGLVVVNSVIGLVGGMVTCGLGTYFLMPILIAGNVVAYRRVFPPLGATAGMTPPPPNAYNWS